MITLQLTLPDAAASGEESPDTDPKSLGSWLEDLPYLAVVESAREMAARLYALNRDERPAGRRLKLMEQFHKAYQRLHESLVDTQLARTGRPEPREAIQAGKTLRREMCFGYKLVLHDSLGPRQRPIKDRETTLAIARAMHYLGIYLIQHYQTYDLIEGSLWQEIVALYRHADQKGLLDTAIPDTAPESTCATIASIFKRIAFLRLSDPYRLPPGTVWDVFHYLGVHQEKIHLQTSADGAAKAGVLALDMGADSAGETGSHDADRYWLNGRALIEALRTDLERLQAGKPPEDAGFSERGTGAEIIHLGTRLLNLWARTPQRGMPRFSGSGTTHLITGLNAIHTRLNNSQPVAETITSDIVCTRINRSTGGLALQCSKYDSAGLWVGQIAAVEAAAPDGAINWLPAIVRWLMQADEQCIRFGIQYLGDNLVALKIRTLESDTEQARNHAALGLQLRHSGNTLQTMIAPSGIFHRGRRLQVLEADRTINVRCSKMLESLATLERFSYFPEES